jgi:hypothetical protein
MARKQDPMLALTESLQSHFSDPVKNFDAISEMLSAARLPLIEAREVLQKQIEWLSCLDIALQANRLKWLQEKTKSNEA